MATATDDVSTLIKAVKTAETTEERADAVRELAEYNIRTHRDVYDSLSQK